MDERIRQALLAAWHNCPEEDRHPPTTEAELRAFEAEFGPIPSDFREYLAVCGGVVGGPSEWIDGIAELRESHRMFREQSAPGGWTMRGVFIIGGDGAGNPFGIEESSGRVLVEDHNFGGIHQMAESFLAFLVEGLHLDNADPD